MLSAVLARLVLILVLLIGSNLLNPLDPLCNPFNRRGFCASRTTGGLNLPSSPESADSRAMADAITILSSMASSGVLAGGLIWYTKSWISARLENAIRHEYEQKLETHKAQLKCETDKEISRLNAQLQISAAERNVRYSRVFEKRVDEIAKVHNKLLAFRDSVNDYAASAEASRGDKFQAMQSKAQEFKDCLDANLLFIPETTANKFAPLYNLLIEKASRFSATGFNWSPADARNDSELFKSLLELLERDCRGIFGDYDHISRGQWQETAVRIEAPQTGMNQPN